jgi:hypothetical protein
VKPITLLLAEDPAIARERLEMVGGRFEIKAVPGQDTTFEAQIPLGRAASAGGADGLAEHRTSNIEL